MRGVALFGRSLHGVRLGALLAAASACRGWLEPGTYDGYVLRSVAIEPLPAIFVDHEGGTLRILADTLFLSSNGTGREVRTSSSRTKSRDPCRCLRREAS